MFSPVFQTVKLGKVPGFGGAASTSRGSATAGFADFFFFGFLRRNDAFLFLFFLFLSFFPGLA